jgi:hypothetical protein
MTCNNPMRFRKLRIAWSVFCGLGCLLLIVLWVWSYLYVYSVIRLGYRPANSVRASSAMLRICA